MKKTLPAFLWCVAVAGWVFLFITGQSHADSFTFDPPVASSPQLKNLHLKSGFERAGTSRDGRINVNTAGVDELQELQGIGPVLAQRICDFRMHQGRYTCTEDLGKVKGIGPYRLEKLSGRVCF